MNAWEEWLTTRDWVATGTWIAAGIAAVSTAITVWWPWYTRLQPVINAEREMLNLNRDQAGNLIVSCNLQRPTLFWRFRNDGDGAAFNFEIEAKGDFDARIVSVTTTSVILTSRAPALAPGQELVVVLYPTSTADIEQPSLEVRWAESPIRLTRNHKRKRFAVPGPLQAKRRLNSQESMLARASISNVAGLHGYTFAQMLGVLGYSEEDLRPEDSPAHPAQY